MKALIVGGEPQPVKLCSEGGGEKKDGGGTTHVCMDRGSPTYQWTLSRPVGIRCLCVVILQNTQLVCAVSLDVFWNDVCKKRLRARVRITFVQSKYHLVHMWPLIL